MDRKPLITISPNSQSLAAKSEKLHSEICESKEPSFSESASQDPFPNTKQERERSLDKVPSTSEISISDHVVIPKDGAADLSCSDMGTASASPESTSTKPETETVEALKDYDKSPTCTKPKHKDVDYFESLDNTIAATIMSIGTSPRSKTFWEGTGAVPKYLPKDTSKTPPKVLPPFQKKTPTKPRVKTELFPDVSPIFESDEQKSEEPLKTEPSSSIETKSPSRSLPKSRSDFKDHSEWVRFNCLDFQDYKRTVNNKQKGAESSLNQFLPVMNSAMKEALNLSAKIAKVRSEVCDKEDALRLQNDKLKYLIGRTMSAVGKIDDIQERLRADILAYTTLTTEGNEGIDMRLSRLLLALCGLNDKELSKESNSLIREAFSEEETNKTPSK